MTIENGITAIGDYAFSGCSGLTNVTIPEGVKTIGDAAFNACQNLTQITIPNTVTTIGNAAISDCPNLKELHIPASVIRINDCHLNYEYRNMFGGCTSLEIITVDPGNTTYAAQDGALFSKEKATLYCVPQGKSSFAVPAGVTKIESRAFYGCAELTEISIPSGVTTIGSEAFFSCAKLTEIDIPSSVTQIGDSAFYNCTGLTKLVIPENVTSYYFMFDGCTALTEVTLPGSKYIYEISGPSLTTVRISEGTEEISGAFSGMTTLTDIYLPASLKTISSNSFANCSNLKNVFFAGTQGQWDTMNIADGNQELSLATVVCTGKDTPVDPDTPDNPDTPDTPDTPDNPDTPTKPETMDITSVPGGLGRRLTVQVEAGHWLTVQTRRAGAISISSIQAPSSASGVVSVTFSAPSGSIVQVWETEKEMTFINGIPTNKILKTVVKEL